MNNFCPYKIGVIDDWHCPQVGQDFIDGLRLAIDEVVAAGGLERNLELATVRVDVDPSTPAVVDRGPLLLDEASTRSDNYAVKLSGAPNAAVTVAVASDNPRARRPAAASVALPPIGVCRRAGIRAGDAQVRGAERRVSSP